MVACDSLDRLKTGGEYRSDTSALTDKSTFWYNRFGNRVRRAVNSITGSLPDNYPLFS